MFYQILYFLSIISSISAGDVVSLDDSNFDIKIDGSVPALVKFYAVIFVH